jgi:glycerophosphoryl diester phosphodiesterase
MVHETGFLAASTPLGFAHRGGAGIGGENTVAAFARAVDLGYQYLEMDIQATADGVAVVLHDDTLSRVFGHPGRIGDLRWADLRSLRVAGAAAIPRLDEVLGAWPRVRLNLDAKSDHVVAPMITAVRRLGAERRVLLASCSDARLAGIRRLVGPGVATSMGVRAVARLVLAARLGGRLRLPPGVVAAQVPLRSGPVPVVTRRFVRHCHAIGLQVHVWTIDEAAEMHRLLDLGVDGIMTDRLEVLREVFTARNAWPVTVPGACAERTDGRSG